MFGTVSIFRIGRRVAISATDLGWRRMIYMEIVRSTEGFDIWVEACQDEYADGAGKGTDSNLLLDCDQRHMTDRVSAIFSKT